MHEPTFIILHLHQRGKYNEDIPTDADIFISEILA